MTQYILPFPETAADAYKISLDSVQYIFKFYFNVRENAWHLTISDQNNVTLIDGVKLVPWMDVLYSHTRDNLPKGSLHLIPINKTFPESDDITYDNLFTSFEFIYYTA